MTASVRSPLAISCLVDKRIVQLIAGEGDRVMSTMKYASLDLETIEAVFNKLGGMDGAQRFLRGELTVAEPVRLWREEDGVIYFEVTSNGMTGPDSRKLEKLPVEVACLIRKMFSDEELKAMGLWRIVVFHDPIKDSGGAPVLLAACCGPEGRWLRARSGRPDAHWFSG